MPRRKNLGAAMFEAMQLGWLQDELIRNPPVAPPREITPAERAAKRQAAITQARADAYQAERAKEAAEHAEALENGRREDMFRAFNATPEEREALQRAKPEDIPQLLAEERRCKPNPEINRSTS